MKQHGWDTYNTVQPLSDAVSRLAVAIHNLKYERDRITADATYNEQAETPAQRRALRQIQAVLHQLERERERLWEILITLDPATFGPQCLKCTRNVERLVTVSSTGERMCRSCANHERVMRQLAEERARLDAAMKTTHTHRATAHI